MNSSPDPRGNREALRGLPGRERLGLVLCSRCAAPLAHADNTDVLLRRLTRLARMGLAPSGAPLLGEGS